ncbi:cupin domain-containing protein [Paraburkholderia xenovorans]|nr:cupin domain-containing protein [Paraburkholderia xenovorans]
MRPIPMTLQVVQTGRLDEFGRQPERVASRELGLYEATSGVFSARRVKTGRQWGISEIFSNRDARFTCIYVLDGYAVLRLSDRLVTLHRHDSICQVPFSATSIAEVSLDFEFVEIQVLDTPLASEVLPGPGESRELVSFDTPDAHVRGAGPRAFFDYRNLGLADITGRRIEVQVIRAQQAREGGTGWHSHTMAQLSYGLSGWALLDIEGVKEPVRQQPGDAICIPAGCGHNAGSFSSDYWALQLQIPVDYDTTPMDTPVRR